MMRCCDVMWSAFYDLRQIDQFALVLTDIT